MSYLTTTPDTLTAAAGNLQSIGSMMAANNAAAAGPTTAVAPPAADVVSALTATQFATHGTLFQAVCAHAQVIHELFVATLRGSAASYTAAEADNAVAAH